MPLVMPLATVGHAWLQDLARASASATLAAIDGATLLGERALLGGFRVPGRRSAGGGCRLYHARQGTIALNLARAQDRDLLPALFAVEDAFTSDDAVAAAIASRNAGDLVARGRMLGLAIAHEDEAPPGPATTRLVSAARASSARSSPRVLDLSALWAGPLAARLLGLTGAHIVRVESRVRAEPTRPGEDAHFGLLNRGKTSVVLDLKDPGDRATVLRLITEADIVIEAARPRALRQLGIDADALLRAQPGLTWMTITGHGASGEAADWVGFGDDCAVAAGLSAALRRASGRTGFVGDAIADPLTGIYAARAAWNAWAHGGGVRLGIAMAGVVAEAIAAARAVDARAFDRSLTDWAAAQGAPIAPVADRRSGAPC
ncbi:CoA transferase [Sphingomonas ginsenosidivorax]|uniref:CoA transferase n=1 Tax=Sphingomonas ginsenosidivorax TaxID=862135 RepID=A0A5C6UEC1_9SPHN|nr:CoA transferase [Sphingomonas ginsenosidivorax]TXC70298.1 CoA transferase [Sphingomonas ginsenosidivorax]